MAAGFKWTKIWTLHKKMTRRKLRVWSHLMKKSLMENFIFDSVRDLSCQNTVKNVDTSVKQKILGDMFSSA